MNSKIKKALCVAVAGASLVGALSGCSNSKEVSNVVTYWAGIPMGDGSAMQKVFRLFNIFMRLQV